MASKTKPRHANAKDVLDVVNCFDAAQLLGLSMETKGNRTRVQCPFHLKILGRMDRTLGNCVISSDGKRCHCFACGTGGNAIDMVKDYMDIGFGKAVDYLAENLAPDLLSGSSFSGIQNKKRCPFSKVDFEMIGINFSDSYVPVGYANSKYEANIMIRRSDDHSLCVRYDPNDENGVLICKRERNELPEMYFKDRAFFNEIVLPFALAAKERYNEALSSEKKRAARYGYDGDTIRQIRERIWKCNEFISDCQT